MTLAIVATFTSEPIADAMEFWTAELGLPASIAFAAYGQVFQELLDPNSLLSRNRRGANLVLVRPEDWLRALSGSGAGLGEAGIRSALERNADELVRAARGLASRSSTPLIVAVCPDSPAARGDRDRRGPLEESVVRILDGLADAPGVSVVGPADLAIYQIDEDHDPRRDRLGHIPYTPSAFAALGTVLARRVHALVTPPHKVVVLDCDNTLWKGVVGEEGVEGIAIPPAFQELQKFMVDLAGRGFLLALCSKNIESDVLEVLDRRAEMAIRREHLVTWRINWEPKSRNIRAMAAELNLGLDSFIFLDDNPVECAEVAAACPEVLTLRLPSESEMAGFLQHVWAFDRPRITDEDRKRTAMYRQEAERARFQREAPSIGDFLAGLGLEIEIREPSAEQIERVSQLTQRTNQFNLTTVRRNEGEIRRLGESGLECRSVEVRDRFGDYGLVGVSIFGPRGDAIEIDSFLLSCRVLGRGVEHRMLAELGRRALDDHLSKVVATLVVTKKNRPAFDFLEAVASPYRSEIEGGFRYEIPAEFAAAVAYQPEASAAVVEEITEAPKLSAMAGEAGRKSERFERIATGLSTAHQVLEAIRARAGRRHPRPIDAPPALPPRTSTEAALTSIWADVLRIEPVGIHDDYFAMGGTSLMAVDLFAQVEQRFGRELPLTSLIEAPTIEALARLVTGEAERDTLVLIRPGSGRPPVFLVHDGDGETMLYRNLAIRLDPGHAVFGLQPLARSGLPMAHTRISEMAAYHVERIRSVQPEGPYLLGGMCAGGVIAYEMARQLRGLGEPVAVVALLDAAEPSASPRAWRESADRLRRFSEVFREAGRVSPARRAMIILSKAARKVAGVSSYVIGDRLRRARDTAQLCLIRACLDRGQEVPQRLRRIGFRAIYLFAEREYRPEGQYDGELLLFRATAGIGPDEPYVYRYEEPMLGWGRVAHGIRAIDVPGGHSSMLQEPNVETLANRLQAGIDEALGRRSSERPEPAMVGAGPS